MLRAIIVFVFILSWVPVAHAAADAGADAKSGKTEITMSVVDALKLAGNMIDAGKLDSAEQILVGIPPMSGGPLEIERWFLLGRLAGLRGDFDTAIRIYRKILDAQPDLARIRFELAVCYMKKKQWYRADYHLRLAMAGNDLPDEAKAMMNYFRYIVRQNKNWNVWFNFGAAPDNNINNGHGGEECVYTIFGVLCRQLPEPKKAVGFNLGLGGNYEFKLTDEHWRWKSEANIYTNVYNKHDFDDLYLSASTGPRYVWERGDVWLAGMLSRRWYGWDGYNWAAGGHLDINYDFTRKISGGLSLRMMESVYDDWGEYMDGETYNATARVVYSFNRARYIVLRGGIERENTNDDTYANWRPLAGVGLGLELPARFSVYMDASFYWQNYDGARWVVDDGRFAQISEESFTQRYSISVSNSKLSIWDFVPTVTVSYTRRDSNIWQREFDKWGLEFSMQQRF